MTIPTLTGEALYTIEFIGDGNAVFKFTTGAEHLIPADEAAAHLTYLLSPRTAAGEPRRWEA